MTTALGLLNNVLRGLRRDVVTDTSTTNSYHLLLLQFLNLEKDALEEQADWEVLRTAVTVTLPSSTQKVSLDTSGGGAADTDVGPTARLLYEHGVYQAGSGVPFDITTLTESSNYAVGSQPQVFDTTDNPERRLQELSWEAMERLILTDDDETDTYPTYFAVRNNGTYKQLAVWPMASDSRTIKMRFLIPQAVIPSTAMDQYTISIPDRPVWLGALMRAVEERGEETGRPLATIQRDYENAMYMAMERERGHDDNTSLPI